MSVVYAFIAFVIGLSILRTWREPETCRRILHLWQRFSPAMARSEEGE